MKRVKSAASNCEGISTTLESLNNIPNDHSFYSPVLFVYFDGTRLMTCMEFQGVEITIELANRRSVVHVGPRLAAGVGHRIVGEFISTLTTSKRTERYITHYLQPII